MQQPNRGYAARRLHEWLAPNVDALSKSVLGYPVFYLVDLSGAVAYLAPADDGLQTGDSFGRRHPCDVLFPRCPYDERYDWTVAAGAEPFRAPRRALYVAGIRPHGDFAYRHEFIVRLAFRIEAQNDIGVQGISYPGCGFAVTPVIYKSSVVTPRSMQYLHFHFACPQDRRVVTCKKTWQVIANASFRFRIVRYEPDFPVVRAQLSQRFVHGTEPASTLARSSCRASASASVLASR